MADFGRPAARILMVVPPDPGITSPGGFPATGVTYGGNDIAPIRWAPWLVGAPLAGLAAGLLGWSAVGDLFAAGVLAASITIVVPLLPMKLRSFQAPQRPLLRVDTSGVWVYLAERGRWRTGSYLHLPWHAITEFIAHQSGKTGYGLGISVNAVGRKHASHAPGRLAGSLRTTGTVVIPTVSATPDLVHAIRHYSGNKYRVRGYRS